MGKYTKLLILVVMLCVGASFFRPHIAHAGGIHDQLIWVAPDSIASDVENRCVNYGWSVVQEQWISARGAPTSTTATVAYGSTSAPLQLNYLTYRCNGGSSIILGSFQITATATFFSPDIPQLDGLIGDMPYAGVGGYNTGDLRDFDFPTGVATASKDIYIAFQSRGTITPLFAAATCAIWNAGDYSGITANFSGSPPNGDPHAFDLCATGWSQFTIHLNVLPQPPPPDYNITSVFTGSNVPGGSGGTVTPGSSYTINARIQNTGDANGPNTWLRIQNPNNTYFTPVTQSPPNTNCLSWNEASDPNTWGDNFLCSSQNLASTKGLQFNSAGPVAGKTCISVNEASDPDSWSDNYLCWTPAANLGLVWHVAGNPGTETYCTQVNEPSEPPAHAWGDNFLCSNTDYDLSWAYAGASGPGSNAYAVSDATNCGSRSPCWYWKYNLFPAGGYDDNVSYTFKVDPATPSGTYCFQIYNARRSTNVAEYYGGQYCITVPPPPPTPTCGGLTVTPSIPEPNQPFNVAFNFSLSPAESAATNYTVTYSIPGVNPSSGSQNGTVPIGGTSGGATFTNLTAPAGIYTGTFTVSGGISLSCPFGNGVPPTTSNPNPPPSITVASKPYLRTYGGDVLAGTDFNTGICNPTNSGIIGYNKGNTGNASSFAGAGTQLATQASSTIVDFTSAALRAPPGNLLAFANTGGGVDPTYGGSFGNVPCVSDYSKFTGTDPGGTVGGTAVANSTHVILKHTGSVTISGNIIYSGSGAWTNVSQIPSFYLIVEGGNIYIDKGVSQLDGVYVAQGGTIYTCTNGSTPYTAADTTVAANCATNQLVINGAFIANQVKFLRTKGTLASAAPGDVGYPAPAANIAEVFNFSPELWLVNPGLTQTNSRYDSITGLPPVL